MSLPAFLIACCVGFSLVASAHAESAATADPIVNGATASAEENRPMFQDIDDKTQHQIFSTPIATLEGDASSLAAHRGKALLLVNVASKCGLTPQYAGLEKLQKEYGDRGFSVIGFPCNQFGAQEPGTAEEIQSFCSLTYGVTFPMFEKIDVNGSGRHPIYTALTPIADRAGESGDIQWNFEKFVVSADGSKVARFRPRTEPYDPALIATIEAALPER